MNFPDKKYQIIYADPPWEYGNFKNIDENRNKRINGDLFKITPYSCMSLKDIKELPIPSISEENSILFIWVTMPLLQDVFGVIQNWGFTYKTCGFVWTKKNKNNNGFYFGLGHYTRANTELCLIATKGKGVKIISKSVQQIITSTISNHSKKPDEARKRILELCGDLPRIELFARTKIHGWDTWGNDPKLQLQPLEAYS